MNDDFEEWLRAENLDITSLRVSLFYEFMKKAFIASRRRTIAEVEEWLLSEVYMNFISLHVEEIKSKLKAMRE